MKTLTTIFTVGLLAFSAVAGKPRPPGKRHVVNRYVTKELLEQCGFLASKEKPTTYVVSGVAVRDIVESLGAKLSDLRSVPCVAMGEDVRTLGFRNTHFVIEAERKQVQGVLVAELLDHRDSKCTVTVLFPHPGYKHQKEPQPEDGEGR